MQTNSPPPKYFIGTLTTRASRKLTAYYNRVLAPLGLTYQQAMALGIIRREEAISLGVFAERYGVGKAAAVTMIERLEAMGLVTREPHPTDGRLNAIRLTVRARTLLPEILEEVNKLEKTVESALGIADLETLVRGLKVICNTDL
ncbi:MAG: MarR family transcriptional regulator [Deltaproteobacteria bacterium]|nr:MarR family transcriptional regulator [Deltaproteobacteria bacterium]